MVTRLTYSPYAFSITALDPEHGYSIIIINDNKFIRCESTHNEYHIWRCINKNCATRAATSVVHCSILVGLQGHHYHLPTKEEHVNLVDWSPQSTWEMEAEEDGSGSWPHNTREGRSSCDQSPEEECQMPPWARQPSSERNATPHIPDSRFENVKFSTIKNLLVPSSTHFQLLNSHQPAPFPVLTSLEALSKFCGGQTTNVDPNAYETTNANQEMEDAQGEHPFSPMQQVENQVEHRPIIVTPQSLRHEEQVEYILPAETSEISSVRSNEPSDGSSSEHLCSQMEEQPPFYELVDVVDVEEIIHKDPLATDDQDCSSAEIDLSLHTKEDFRLNEEDTAFFQTLGPHLKLLTAPDKSIFRKKVMGILSQLCKKVTIHHTNR